MTFHVYESTGVDTPPVLEQLRGLTGVGAFGIPPAIIAGGGAAAAIAIAAWLDDPDWSTGQYNDYMLAMDNAIKEYDKLGWSSGCWQQNPAKLRQFKTFWGEFSRHWGEYGRQSVYLSDSAEKPARRHLRTLAGWAKWLEKNCGVDIGPSVVKPGDPLIGGGGSGVAPRTVTDWGKVAQWGAIGLGAIVVLNIVSGVRGAFPARQPPR